MSLPLSHAPTCEDCTTVVPQHTHCQSCFELNARNFEQRRKRAESYASTAKLLLQTSPTINTQHENPPHNTRTKECRRSTTISTQNEDTTTRHTEGHHHTTHGTSRSDAGDLMRGGGPGGSLGYASVVPEGVSGGPAFTNLSISPVAWKDASVTVPRSVTAPLTFAFTGWGFLFVYKRLWFFKFA